MTQPQPAVGRRPRLLLAVAAAAVGFAAADTYVVVLALPDMMASVGLNLDQLQRAAPIVSGFLLGYVAVLPLIGRISDLRGRVPVLGGSLVIFSFGSMVTAASYDLSSMVVGRFLQGVGGGGLVPATLALVADLWPVERRGLPLGLVGAVQELGSVLGPLYGAMILTVSTWHTIFWVNVVAGLVLATALLGMGAPAAVHPAHVLDGAEALEGSALRRGHYDWAGALLGAAATTGLALLLIAPHGLTSGLTTGLAYVPYVGDTRWSTPLAFATYTLAVLFPLRELTAARPLLDLRAAATMRTAADLPGAALLGTALAGVVLAFATADPATEVLSPLGSWFLIGAGAAGGLFWWRQRTAVAPLVPHRALTARAAWGSLLVSFFVGSSLIAALVDVPVFARVTVYAHSQVGAALVLVRLLAALPLGALTGGLLLRRVPVAVLVSTGMALAGVAFAWMTRWDTNSLHSSLATVPLALAGFGFGLAIAPVNAALLAATRADVHGVASAFLVVARMVGMLVGISALTTLGLRRFYAVVAEMPSIRQVCRSPDLCHAYVVQLKLAGISQLHAIFAGAAVCAAIAALLGVTLLRRPVAAAGHRGRPLQRNS